MGTSGGYETPAFVADYYDMIPAYAARRDVPFYVEYTQSAGGPVLELGSGTGRVLIPTARAGYRIVGLDLSEFMLAKCREKLSAEPLNVQERVRLVNADMRAFDLGETFGLITTPFRSFQHLLARCSFRVAEIFGDHERSPFGDDSPEMIFVAEKCADI